MSSPCGYLISIWARKAISRSSIQVGVHQVSLWWIWVWGCLVSSALGASCDYLVIRVSYPSMELDEGLEDSYLCCPELVLVSGVKAGIWSLPHVELCSLPTSTLGEVTQVLLLWGKSSEPLQEWSHFSCEEMVGRLGKGCPTKGVLEVASHKALAQTL